MFIFVLPVLMVTTATALFTTTTGMNFVIVAVAAAEWQRRKGYKGGEGRLSEREAGAYYSTKFDKNSDHDLSMILGQLANILPARLEPYVGKKYDFTKSEGHLLRAILQPVELVLNELEGIKISMEEDPDNLELSELYIATLGSLGTLAQPVVAFLEQFPVKRTKKVS